MRKIRSIGVWGLGLGVIRAKDAENADDSEDAEERWVEWERPARCEMVERYPDERHLCLGLRVWGLRFGVYGSWFGVEGRGVAK